MSRGERKAMIRARPPRPELEPAMPPVSISRSSFYYSAQGGEPGEPGADASDRRVVSEVSVLTAAARWPASCGARVIEVGRHRVRRLMRLMGLEAIYQAPRTSDAAPGAPDLSLSSQGAGDRPAQSGLVCRHHLHPGAARLSVPGRDHGLGDTPCPVLAAVEHHGCRVLRRGSEGGAGPIRQAGDLQHRPGQPVHQPRLHRRAQGGGCGTISMDGRGRCMDNIFIERLWRSLKYEAVYLHDLTDGFKAERVIGEWIDFYNTERPHSVPGRPHAGRGLRGRAPVDMMDKARALPTSPQAQQPQQDVINRVLAA